MLDSLIKRLEEEENEQNVEAFTFKNVKTIIDPNVKRADKIKICLSLVCKN